MAGFEDFKLGWASVAAPRLLAAKQAQQASELEQMQAQALAQHAGQLLAPLRKSARNEAHNGILDYIQGAFESGNPELVKQAIQDIGSYQSNTLDMIKPTANVKDYEYLGGIAPDIATPDFFRQMLIKPSTQINMGRGAPPSGYQYVNKEGDGPDTLTFVPGGPEDPKRKPMTESQSKATGFAKRATSAHSILNSLEETVDTKAITAKNMAENIPLIGPITGGIANAQLSPDQQRVDQAKRAFINALLRQDSGATIQADEFDNYSKQFFKQPGDSPAAIAQKRKAREDAIAGLEAASGSELREAPVTPTYKDYKKGKTPPTPPVQAAPTITESMTLPNGTRVHKVNGKWMAE